MSESCFSRTSHRISNILVMQGSREPLPIQTQSIVQSLLKVVCAFPVKGTGGQHEWGGASRPGAFVKPGQSFKSSLSPIKFPFSCRVHSHLLEPHSQENSLAGCPHINHVPCASPCLPVSFQRNGTFVFPHCNITSLHLDSSVSTSCFMWSRTRRETSPFVCA